MSELTTIVGFMAGFVTTAANLPQVWKTYRTKSGEGLSFRMLLGLAIGVGLVDCLWNHEQVATAHCDQRRRAPADIVLDRNEVQIRSLAHERLKRPPAVANRGRIRFTPSISVGRVEVGVQFRHSALSFAGACSFRAQLFGELVGVHGVLVRLFAEFVSG